MTSNEFFTKCKRRVFAFWYRARRGKIAVRNDQVMFFTFQGKYTCNPKYICSSLHGLSPETKCIWVVACDEDRAGFPDFPETVIYGTPAYFKALYASKVLVDNGFNFVKLPFCKNEGQYYMETMHGSLGIKRIDAASNPNRKRNRIGFRCGKLADYVISNSQFETDVYRSSFWEKTPVLVYGHARNDILINGRDDASEDDPREKVRRFYGLPDEAKLALYAPTFAREASKEFEAFDAGLLRKCLTERFGGEWYILKRLHPKDARTRSVSAEGEFVLDGNRFTDIHELMVAIDFAVTDYSSWLFDYVITKKPGMIYAPDLEEYQNSTGFYYPITSTPFPLATDSASFSRMIREFDVEKYREEVDLFLKEKGCVDDGKAAGRAASAVLGLLSDRRPDM